MMMPANFSAIAESEMTYVVGGGLIDALGAVTAPVWNASNVKTFNTNLVQIVGNSYVSKVISGTVGVIFNGDYMTKYTNADNEEVRKTVFGKNKGLWDALDPNGDKGTTNGFNKFLQGVGALAAVYQLGTSTAKTVVGEANPIGVKGTSVGDGLSF